MLMAEYGFQVRLPADAKGLKLDDEYFFVVCQGIEQRIGIHEYRHRHLVNGRSVNNVAVMGRKSADI